MPCLCKSCLEIRSELSALNELVPSEVREQIRKEIDEGVRKLAEQYIVVRRFDNGFEGVYSKGGEGTDYAAAVTLAKKHAIQSNASVEYVIVKLVRGFKKSDVTEIVY